MRPAPRWSRRHRPPLGAALPENQKLATITTPATIAPNRTRTPSRNDDYNSQEAGQAPSRRDVTFDPPSFFSPAIERADGGLTTRLLIGGDWRPAAGSEEFEDRSPIDGSVLARPAKATTDDVMPNSDGSVLQRHTSSSTM